MASDQVSVEGVRETMKALRELDKAVAREAMKSIKAPAVATAAQLRSVAPAQPLSGMPSYPVKATANYGGRARASRDRPLVKIKLTGGGWTVASDMARDSAPGESMTRNLTNKYGQASRWAWPTVEQRISSIQRAVVQACKDAEQTLNRLLRER